MKVDARRRSEGASGTAAVIGFLSLGSLVALPAIALAEGSAPASVSSSDGFGFLGVVAAGVLGLCAIGGLVLRARARQRFADASADRDDAKPKRKNTTTPPAPAQPPMEHFGPFDLFEKIGEGGMAEVFTARRREGVDESTFVVKRLKPTLAREPEVVEKFVQEGDLAVQLTHRNIARTWSSGVIGDAHYMIQEYVVGRDVGQLTRRMVELKQRPLSPAAIFHIAYEVLGALEYAHARRNDAGQPMGLVHRDVSPENILISTTGKVKLLDFGLAKTVGLGGERGAKDKPHGNVDFMSPEQATASTVDGRSDLFSLGLVMYFCAARGPLYRGKTVYDQLVAAATGPQEEELAYVAGLPPPLPEMLTDVLSVKPDERPRSAKVLRDRLAPYTRGGAAELAAVLERVFGQELERECTQAGVLNVRAASAARTSSPDIRDRRRSAAG